MLEIEQIGVKTTVDRWHRAVLVTLLLVQAVLLTIISWKTSPNRTEVGHLGAAVYFWKFGKHDVFHVNPPLVRFLVGAPLSLISQLKYEWSGYSPNPQDRCEWRLGNDFIAANELKDLRWYVFLARVTCIPLILLGGYFGYCFASELYGPWSGMCFLLLWGFSPLILGWGATICPDAIAASIGMIGLYMFWKWLKRPTWTWTIVSGVLLGLMVLTKLTWLIAFPIWFILWALWSLLSTKESAKPRMIHAVALFLTAIYVINMGYGFDGSFRMLKNYEFISESFSGKVTSKNELVETGNRFNGSYFGVVPVPLPCELIQGIDTQKYDFEKGMESYVCGAWSDRGWWWYYGFVLMLKEPLGLLAVTVLAFITSLFFPRLNASFREELILLIPIIGLFLFISSQTGISAHPRYILLVLPFLFLFISKMGQSFTLKKPVLAALTLICLAQFVISSTLVFPHSMSHLNELAGGPRQWPRFLLGSNISWGQDAYSLEEWCRNNPNAHPLYISYSQAISPEKLGINRMGDVPTEKTSGWLLVDLNELYEKRERFDWLKEQEPIEMIGYGIWVFRCE